MSLRTVSSMMGRAKEGYFRYGEPLLYRPWNELQRCVFGTISLNGVEDLLFLAEYFFNLEEKTKSLRESLEIYGKLSVFSVEC